ncbi:hypothetical protein WMY93_017237 [Mugilogobius chulae]|uniref:Uncharacterized protein n=1 Tax=Mugilogobius chulae TaxID=88201 RepID=A0AAW0NXS8_9GOBI
MTGQMSLDHAKQVSKLKRDKEEACNATKIFQKELEQQPQLKKSKSENWESSKKEMGDKMLQMKEAMMKLEKNMFQTQASLEEQKQETQTTLDRAEMIQTQLKEEKETSKELREQIKTPTAAFAKSNTGEDGGEGEQKKAARWSLEAAVAKFETERKKMQLDFESVKEAVMNYKQSAEEEMKHLSHKLEMKEKAEVVVEKEIEQEEVESLKTAQDVKISEIEKETTTSTEWKEQKTSAANEKLNPISLVRTRRLSTKRRRDKQKPRIFREKMEKVQEEVTEAKKTEEEEVQTTNEACQIPKEALMKNKKHQEEVESVKTAQDVKVREIEKKTTTSTEQKD